MGAFDGELASLGYSSGDTTKRSSEPNMKKVAPEAGMECHVMYRNWSYTPVTVLSVHKEVAVLRRKEPVKGWGGQEWEFPVKLRTTSFFIPEDSYEFHTEDW